MKIGNISQPGLHCRNFLIGFQFLMRTALQEGVKDRNIFQIL